MKLAEATLTIGGRVFRTYDRVQTPEGFGEILGLDPFADEEIGVKLDDGRVLWFGFVDAVVDVVVEAPAALAEGGQDGGS